MVRVTVAAACFGLFHVSLDALEKSVNDMPASNIKAYLDVVIFIKNVSWETSNCLKLSS